MPVKYYNKMYNIIYLTLSPPSVIFLLPCRKRAERRAVARAAGWRSWRTNLTRTDREARVNTHTRSITSANTSRPGSVPFCLKLPFEWRRSPGMPTPIHEPGETTSQRAFQHFKEEMINHTDI